jgi:hypothetical protein
VQRPGKRLEATFEYEGRRIEALLTRLIDTEARFEYATPRPQQGLRPGLHLSFDVQTPYGVAPCSGNVVWVHDEPRRYSWAVKLSKLPPPNYQKVQHALA